MARQKSIRLFGEGKTEAVFLNHLRTIYAPEIRACVQVDAGQGGSPKQVAEPKNPFLQPLPREGFQLLLLIQPGIMFPY